MRESSFSLLGCGFSQVRTQLLGHQSTLVVAKKLITNEGPYALTKGFTASLLKQLFHISQQYVSVGAVKEVLAPIKEPLYRTAPEQLMTSAFGAFVCSPFDLAFVRMQADSVLPLAQRRCYKDVLHAVSRIAADDGVLGLWKGAGLSVAKAMAASVGMLASYDKTEAEGTGDVDDHSLQWQMLEYKIPSACSFPKLIGATILAAGLSAPIDFLKTQIQSQRGNEKQFYAGAVDCARKSLKAGGFTTFYTGFPAYYVRLAVPAIVSWTFIKVTSNVRLLDGVSRDIE